LSLEGLGRLLAAKITAVKAAKKFFMEASITMIFTTLNQSSRIIA